MDTSLNPCLCKDLYAYLMELCLGLGFSYLLVRNSPTSNNEVDWFCHTPIPGPTRLANPNRVRGAIPYTRTLYLIFFKNRIGTCGYGPHLLT